MKAKGISQREIAVHLGLSQPAVFRRLNGDVDFTITELSAVAFFLNLPIADLLTTPSSVTPAGDDEGVPVLADTA